MNALRVGYAIGVVVLVAVPLLMPFTGLLEPTAWIWTNDDIARLLYLARNTLILTTATTALSVPLGICLAVLLFRTSFTGRRCIQFVLVLALFVPLPVLTSSWQGLLGADGWLPMEFWRGAAARPWVTGLGAAIWIHTLAAVPWVAFIVGIGLTWVESELEDEAAQIVGPWRVLALVTLPRARASVLAAALFVVLQTAGETNVTDILMVPTLADEMRTQFALGDRAALSRTLVLALPSLLLVWGAMLAVLAYLEKHLPPLAPPARELGPLDLGRARLRLGAAIVLVMVLCAPLSSLIWKLGLSAPPGHRPIGEVASLTWHFETAWHFLQAETRLLGITLAATLATSVVAGFLVAGLALSACWLARESRWFRAILFSALTWIWVLPGSAVGIGLHDTIMAIVQHMPEGPWTLLLYRGPSPLPLVWAQTIRALPIAIVFLWPVVRMIPREWFEEARLGGAGPASEFVHVILPMTWRAELVTALASAALCLGEVAASARVETPGWESFTKMLLDRMHYGVDNTVAALSILMLAGLALFALGSVSLWQLMRSLGSTN
jgi:iron(III) transport system permease protein